MKSVRSLLSQGNDKLGTAIHVWSLPAVTTCPASTSVCRAVCYATKSRFLLPSTQKRLAWNLEQTRSDDFCGRMAKEIKAKGCLVIRVHSSGDFMDVEYAERWLWIMKKFPKPRYYWYSRSWKISDIATVLEKMAALKQVRGWYSVDSETGMPEHIPKGVRTAYLQVDDTVEEADLIFRVRRLRKQPRPRIGLTVLPQCPNESDSEISCGACTKCFR